MNTQDSSTRGPIRVGVGGWTYPEWRNNFYPEGWVQSRELSYASRQLTAIEINSTYYGNQKPASFAKWRDETPDGFVFSVKANKFTTAHRVLADGSESIARFIGSGLSALGPKLGPIVWQFAPSKRFDAADFEAFLKLLPPEVDGLPLRHVLDVRHASFMCEPYLELARRYRASTAFADSDEHPSFADLTGELVYARLMRSQADQPLGYSAEALDRWAARARQWAAGSEPDDLPRVGASVDHAAEPRDVFVFVISGAKERAPHAAMGLIERLKAAG